MEPQARHTRRLARAATHALENQRGFGFVSVLLALLIAAVLYFGYFKMQDTMSARSTGIAALDSSRTVACRANEANIESNIQLWAVDHPGEDATIDALRASGLNIPTCPSGGTYSITANKVHCSIHG